MDRITYLAAEAQVQLGVGSALVRPNGVVTWACDTTPDLYEIPPVATQWFGPPANWAQPD